MFEGDGHRARAGAEIQYGKNSGGRVEGGEFFQGGFDERFCVGPGNQYRRVYTKVKAVKFPAAGNVRGTFAGKAAFYISAKAGKIRRGQFRGIKVQFFPADAKDAGQQQARVKSGASCLGKPDTPFRKGFLYTHGRA
jgi:hypothetical protein